jgi:hypothetical protein
VTTSGAEEGFAAQVAAAVGIRKDQPRSARAEVAQGADGPAGLR